MAEKFDFTGYVPGTVGSSIVLEDGPFDPAKIFMGLYTTASEVNPPTVPTDFGFPAVGVFPRKPVTAWAAVDTQEDGSVQYTSPVLDFSWSEGFDLLTYNGAYLATSATVGQLVAYVEFNTPVALLSSSGHLKYVLRLTVQLSGLIVADIIRIDG